MRGGHHARRLVEPGGEALLCVCLAARVLCAPALASTARTRSRATGQGLALDLRARAPGHHPARRDFRLVPKTPLPHRAQDELFITSATPLTSRSEASTPSTRTGR